jgi:hypothetical protein
LLKNFILSSMFIFEKSVFYSMLPNYNGLNLKVGEMWDMSSYVRKIYSISFFKSLNFKKVSLNLSIRKGESKKTSPYMLAISKITTMCVGKNIIGKLSYTHFVLRVNFNENWHFIDLPIIHDGDESMQYHIH